jgi:hypothetical protein
VVVVEDVNLSRIVAAVHDHIFIVPILVADENVENKDASADLRHFTDDDIFENGHKAGTLKIKIQGRKQLYVVRSKTGDRTRRNGQSEALADLRCNVFTGYSVRDRIGWRFVVRLGVSKSAPLLIEPFVELVQRTDLVRLKKRAINECRPTRFRHGSDPTAIIVNTRPVRKTKAAKGRASAAGRWGVRTAV